MSRAASVCRDDFQPCITWGEPARLMADAMNRGRPERAWFWREEGASRSILGSKHDVDGSGTSSENVALRFCNYFSIIQSHHVWKIHSNHPGIKLEPALGTYKKTKLNICHHMLTSSTHLQNRSFHVVERTRTSRKCQKMKNARAKRAKLLFFTVKYANLWGFCCRRRRGCLSSLL